MSAAGGRVFEASMSRVILWVSAFACTILVVGGVVAIGVAFQAAVPMPARMTGLIGGILIISVVPAVAAFAPRRYVVCAGDLVIVRLISRISIARANIVEARRIDLKDLGFTIRTAGSGGLFGVFGYFWSRNIGNFHAYATRQNNYVLVRLGSGMPIVLSPDDPDGLVAALNDGAVRV